MSNVAEGQSSTRFKDSKQNEDIQNKTQQKTTIEASEHQCAIQGPPSESKLESSLERSSSPDDENSQSLRKSTYINIPGFAPEEAIQKVREKDFIPPFERNTLAQLDGRESLNLAGVKSHPRKTTQAEINVEAISVEKIPSEEMSVEAQLGRQSILGKFGIHLDIPVTTDTNRKKSLIKQPLCDYTISEQPFNAKDQKKKEATADMFKTRALGDKLSQGAEAADEMTETELDERVSINIAKLLALQKRFINDSEMKVLHTQQDSPDFDAMKSKLPQQAPLVFDRMGSKLTQPTSSATSILRSYITRTGIFAAGIRQQFIQQDLSAAHRMRPLLTQQAPSVAIGMRPQLTQYYPSVSGMRVPFIQETPSTVARMSSQLTQQASPAAEAGMSSQLAQQFLAVTETSAPITKQKPRAAAGRKVKLTAAQLPSWKNLTMEDALRSRSAVHRDPPNTEDSVDLEKRLPPSVRDLPEINDQNITKGTKGHRFQLPLPQKRRPPYRSLTQRMYLQKMMKVVDLRKEKKKNVKKKKKSRCACNDDLPDDSRKTSSSDEPKSPPKSIPSSPELQFHLEL